MSGVAPSRLGAERTIPLAEAPVIVAHNGAQALRMEEESGSMKVDKLADFIVLARELFEIPQEPISEMRALETLVAGRVVSRSMGRLSSE